MKHYRTAPQVQDVGAPTVIEFRRDNLAAVSVRVVIGTVEFPWHRLTEHDARNVVELLHDQ